MGLNNKILTYNVNGIRDYDKRKRVFNHLHHLDANIIFLQETHSDKKTEKLWKSEWGSSILFSHGESNARGVAILFSKKSKYKIIKTAKDTEGRVLAVAVEVNNRQYTFATFYAPNVDDPSFFEKAFGLVNSLQIDLQIVGGDFNTVLDLQLDLKGDKGYSNPKTRAFINEYLLDTELSDIWREQHKEEFRSSFIRKKPTLLLERIDFLLVSKSLRQNVVFSDILPSYLSDHAIPVIDIYFSTMKPNKGYWKFNNSLLEDETFCSQIVDSILETLINMKDLPITQKWDMLKLAFRDVAIRRGIQIAKGRNNKIQVLQRAIKNNIASRDDDAPLFFDDYTSNINNLQTELNDLLQQKVQGAIIRSRSNWAELGEKNSAFFLNLEKQNFNKKVITRLIDPETDETVTDPKEILRVLNTFFCKVYSKKQGAILDPDYLGTTVLPQVSEGDKFMMDGPIQLEEIHIALKQLKKSKCPGLDGITPEFYIKFWPYLAKIFHKLFEEIVDSKLLHTTARDGIISLLDKPDKNPLCVPNWRPLTLLNTDYKIFAKVLANRLLHVLPYIINEDQFGYIKGRSISDNLLDLFSVIQHCEETGLNAILISVDFRRAYDSLSWEALREILRAYNFGENFIDMIMICYTQIRSAVVNNNVWTQWLYPEVGLRQGCVLSCYLFILSTQLISARINQNDNIKGIKIGSKTKKSDQYVDDLWNVIMYEIESFNELLYEYSEFEDYTGLSINYDKTEILRIGSLCDTDAKFYSDLPLKWSDGPIRVLGVKIHPCYKTLVELNYEDLLNKVQNLFKVWGTRSLTPIGRIVVVNTLCNSQFVYKLQCLPSPTQHFFNTYMKNVKAFIWEGKKSKVKYERLTNTYENGGLQLRDLKTVDASLKIAKVHHILQNKYFWTSYFFNKFDLVTDSLDELNFSHRDVRKHFEPSYFSDVLYNWAKMNFHKPLDSTDILKQPLWFNSFVKNQGKWLYVKPLAQARITKISHLYNLDYGRFDSYQEFVQTYGKIVDFLTYYRIIQSIPLKWKECLKQNEGEILDKTTPWAVSFHNTK